MRLSLCLSTLALLDMAITSPTIGEHNVQPSDCAVVKDIVSNLSLAKATPFCSSYLHISTVSSTITTTVTSVYTSTPAAPKTTVFAPGNPSTGRKRDARPEFEREAHAAEAASAADVTTPSYLSTVATSSISTACSCLSIPTPTKTVTSTRTRTSITVAPTPPTSTLTVYPCATDASGALPSPGPAYASASGGSYTTSGNSKYDLDTPEGASAVACCHTCNFKVRNCIQAYWYSYQGCVVNSADTVVGTGAGISSTCPSGKVAALTYGPDTNPPFRSTGRIAGPCGVAYTNSV